MNFQIEEEILKFLLFSMMDVTFLSVIPKKECFLSLADGRYEYSVLIQSQ
jgi:hypothetical protein